MTIKDFLFAVINFVILFGAMFLITRKMIVRMFKERKEKIAQDLEQSHQADLESQRLSTDVAQARDQARQQEDALLAETRAQVERSSREAEKLRTEEADALRRNAIQTEKQLRSQMHGQVSAQVIRQVASQAGETLKTSTFAPERQALVERYIEQVKEVVAAMPSDILNMNELKKLNISIASPEPLTDEEMKKVTQILCETFLSVRNEVDDGLVGGVRMQVGDTVYDGTLAHQLDRLSQEVEFNSRMDDQEELSVLESIREKLSGTDNSIDVYQTGKVISVSDGICHVSGLADVMAGEMLEFEGSLRGMVMDLDKNNVGVVLLGDFSTIQEGDTVRRTGHIIEVPVGEAMCGRVVDALGRPVDGKGPIQNDGFRAVESPAPSVLHRQGVTVPLQTGIKAIDALVPIGRGQRELIIGDRQTGKTAIALDTIVNQKGKGVHCIYVAIGQKASTVAALVENLKEHGALPYTIIVSATAADPAAMQYYAPFAGAAIGEYFRDRGYSALVVYDDLSKQAVAYREVSLILRRPSGREAYPGDVFYLHSRLLERAARINDQQEVAEQMNDLPECMKGHVKGGGSLTALPIIETQAGDVSAYIPTNVISITDGQIFLETDLFNQGFRPAINVGISVSRVGGSAQIKSMKKVAGTLKIDMAQYRELEAFSKFSSDMDAVTAMTLDRGRKNDQLLVQPQYRPMPVGEQVAILYCGVHGLMHDVPMDKVRDCQDQFLDAMRSQHADVIETLGDGKLTDDAIKAVEETMANVAGQYKA